jgi:hypothetical protein
MELTLMDIFRSCVRIVTVTVSLEHATEPYSRIGIKVYTLHTTHGKFLMCNLLQTSHC